MKFFTKHESALEWKADVLCTKFRCGVLVLLTSLTLSCANPGIKQLNCIGLNKTEIIKRFGEPDDIQYEKKTSLYLHGPMEAFWDEIQLGESIEIWIFSVPEGEKRLYYLPSGKEVIEEMFWDHDLSKNPVF